MLSQFAGKSWGEFVADKIVELIYHPSWRITLLQLIKDIIPVLAQPPQIAGIQSDEKIQLVRDKLREVAQFLFDHFTQGLKLPFQDKSGALIDHLAGEALYTQFIKYTQPPDPSFLEKALNPLIPVMDELLLEIKWIDAFRKESICFEGDRLFWKNYLKMALDHLVAISSEENPVHCRERLVKELFVCDEQTMRRRLLDEIPDNMLSTGGWVDMPAPTVDEMSSSLTSISESWFLSRPNSAPSSPPPAAAAAAPPPPEPATSIFIDEYMGDGRKKLKELPQIFGFTYNLQGC